VKPVAADSIRVAVIADTIEGPGGMGRYARELVAALARRADLDLLVVAPSAARERLATARSVRPVRLLPLPGLGQAADALWEWGRLGARLRAAGIDVVHGTKHLLPRGDLPTVLTVHDLTVLSLPGEAGLLRRVLLPSQYRSALDRATALLTVSSATRDRLADFDERWWAKAVPVANGSSSDLLGLRPEPIEGLDEVPFGLVVGDLSPRKNVGLLAAVWDDVYTATGAVLVLVGSGGLKSAELDRRLGDLESRGRARRLGTVSGPALRWCYEHCAAVLFPSVEEGFGFPVVEARLFGAPVVASTDPAVVEAAAGTAVHVDPFDREGWRDALVEALSDVRPERRPAGGGDTPSLPTWDDHAAGAVGLYRQVLDASASGEGAEGPGSQAVRRR